MSFGREHAMQGHVVSLSERSAARLAESFKGSVCYHCRREIFGEEFAHRGAFILHRD